MNFELKTIFTNRIFSIFELHTTKIRSLFFFARCSSLRSSYFFVIFNKKKRSRDIREYSILKSSRPY